MLKLTGECQYSPIRTGMIKGEFTFSVFPNPTDKLLNISFEKNLPEEIIIKSASGHELLRTAANQDLHQIDISWLPQGVYFCQLLGKTGHIGAKRFIKTK